MRIYDFFNRSSICSHGEYCWLVYSLSYIIPRGVFAHLLLREERQQVVSLILSYYHEHELVSIPIEIWTWVNINCRVLSNCLDIVYLHIGLSSD